MSDPTHSVEGTPPLLDEAAQLAQFRRFIDIGLIVNAVFLAISLTGAILWRDPAMTIGTVMLALCGGVGLVAHALARRARVAAAAITVAGGLLAVCFAMALVSPYGTETIAVLIVLAVAVVLSWLRGARLRRMIVASLMVSAATRMLALVRPGGTVPPPLPRVFLQIVGPLATTVVVLWLLWQYSDRIWRTLSSEAAARRVAEEATQRSERLVEELRDAVKTRDEFMSIAAHELRTPLTTIRLLIENLERTAKRNGAVVSQEQLDRAIYPLDRQSRRLGALVESLLDVSRISGGRLELQREYVDLGTIVREVLSRSRDDIERLGCPVTLHADHAVMGWWDAPRIDTAVTNVLTNALKYGNRRPIDITVEECDGVARLTVRDRGIGIAEGAQTRIFERFERAAPSRNYGGLGLGLWIVRQIVEAHGGAVRAESAAGDGATFVLELPMTLATHPQARQGAFDGIGVLS